MERLPCDAAPDAPDFGRLYADAASPLSPRMASRSSAKRWRHSGSRTASSLVSAVTGEPPERELQPWFADAERARLGPPGHWPAEVAPAWGAQGAKPMEVDPSRRNREDGPMPPRLSGSRRGTPSPRNATAQQPENREDEGRLGRSDGLALGRPWVYIHADLPTQTGQAGRRSIRAGCCRGRGTRPPSRPTAPPRRRSGSMALRVPPAAATPRGRPGGHTEGHMVEACPRFTEGFAGVALVAV